MSIKPQVLFGNNQEAMLAAVAVCLESSQSIEHNNIETLKGLEKEDRIQEACFACCGKSV